MKKEKNLNSALTRGLNIIELLASQNEDVSFGEIKSRLEIPSTSLQRLLNILQERDYVRQNLENSKYQLGFKLITVAGVLLNRLNLRAVARPFMQKLMMKSKETVELAILDKGEILYIDKCESIESIRLVAQVGSRYRALHPTAVGKVFLAYMSEEESMYIIKERGLNKYTENTITEIDALKKELRKIRLNGYAFDDQEVRLGVRRISAPIFNYSNQLVGAVGIAGPTFRMRKSRIDEMATLVKQTAKDISYNLGKKAEE